jgi:hypothetical protein
MAGDSENFSSKPASTNDYTTKNSTATYSDTNRGDSGASRVGNSEPNPYGANVKK